ncbi:MAG: hypothetical protein A2Y21_11510 [Clostridiales bacterium GWC2_40_7]|nr:MAG: hypothetical protein A2Y21_11510 [Clostridiales bacterium GWC2_40_7]
MTALDMQQIIKKSPQALLKNNIGIPIQCSYGTDRPIFNFQRLILPVYIIPLNSKAETKNSYK